MNKLSCAMCGQRYYGSWSPDLVCDFCHAPLEETAWTSSGGRRAAMVPVPLVRPPLGADPRSGNHESALAGFTSRMER